MLKYGAAIIGLGNIAWKYDMNHSKSLKGSRTHAGTYLLCDRTRLIGGCSVDSDDREGFRQSYHIPVFKDHEQMLADLNPDIVSICSPTEHHFEQTMACMDAGVPMIWLEKPPTATLEQLDRLMDRQNLSGCRTKILVGYQRRYASVFRRLKENLQKGALGKIKSVQVNYSRGLMNNGSHYVDLLFFILGDSQIPELCFALNKGLSENPIFVLSFPDGPLAAFNGIDVTYHCMDIAITGDLGRASILYGGLETRWEKRCEQELFPANFKLMEAIENPLGPGGFQEAMAGELDDLIRSHENDVQPLSNLETSRNTIQVLDEVCRYLKIKK